MSITVSITASNDQGTITRSATAEIDTVQSVLSYSITAQEECERIKATIRALADGLDAHGKNPSP